MLVRRNTIGEDIKFEKNRILHINFNQDQGCFVLATETGFRVFNTYPFKETFSRDFGMGIGYVEMLYRSNILAIVGGGTFPKQSLDTVMIWDDNQAKIIADLKFKSDVKSVKLRANKIAVVLEDKVFIYNFSDLKLVDLIETCKNHKGLCSFNNESDNTILVVPDRQIGHVVARHYDLNKTTKIKAHQSTLSFLELSQTGNKLASSSEKGTVIRIHNPLTGDHLQELRRGLEYAQIYSLNFDYHGRWLAISCDSGTIHLFSLKLSLEEKKALGIDPNLPEPKNPKSRFWFMKYILPYFDSEWSFAKFRVKDTRTKVGFGPVDNSIIVISYEGNYYSAIFDPLNGGECKGENTLKIQNPPNE